MTVVRGTTKHRRLLLTVGEVSELVGWRPKDVYKRGPALPGYVKIGRSVRFREVPLLRWLRDEDDSGEQVNPL